MSAAEPGGGSGGRGRIRELSLSVPRTARYAALGDLSGRGVRELWLVCHGYKQLARRFLRRFLALDDGSRLLVAPEGLSRFYLDAADQRHGPEHRVGASWMTREDRLAEIDDYVRYLDALAARIAEGLEAPPERTVALGFSQGVHTVSRWVVMGRREPPHELILWGAYLPPDLDMDRARLRLEGVDVTLVRGAEDPYADPELLDRERERLKRAGVEYRERVFPGGHEIDGEVLRRLAQR